VGFERDAFEERVGGLRHISLDSCACIYLLTGTEPFTAPVRGLFERADARRLAISLSRLVQMELLVHPMRSRDLRERELIFDLTERAIGVETTDLTRSVLFLAAEIRAHTRLKTPDAIVVASAAANGCEAIVGNDKRFRDLDGLRGTRLMAMGSRVVPLPEYVHLGDYDVDAERTVKAGRDKQ
jgi:predicted nucleic acid-binding protein